MSRVYNNWERLVRATLQRDQLRPNAEIHGIAVSMRPVQPDWVQQTTNINALLEAADEIEEEDPNLARILCEQAYSMSEKLDPNNYGVGVLRFKTGLMSIIKQQHLKRDGVQINCNRDVEHLWDFYKKYKRQYRVDDIQREEQRLSESGTFTANLGSLGLRSNETKKASATLRALVEVMESLSKDTCPDGVGRLR